MTKKDIMQIIPAENWWAAYEVQGEINVLRLVCWALILETAERVTDMKYVEGITEEQQGTGLAENECFIGYIYAFTEEEAKKRAEREHRLPPKSCLPKEKW